MDQQFSLSWNNFYGNLSKGFAGLLGKGEFVDVTIAVDGHLLQAHKVILSICSPYFKKMFQLNPCQHPIVVLRDVSHKAMRDLLQFMYHGEVSVKREDLTSFIGTAELLQIKGLTNKETEDEEIVSEPELPNQDSRSQKSNTKDSKNTTELTENPEEPQCNATNNTDLMQQKELIDKLQRLSNLKRKSEEFLQNNFYNEITSIEKRAKFKEKTAFSTQDINLVFPNTYNHINNMFEERSEVTNAYKNHISPVLQRSLEVDDKKLDQSISSNSPVDCKTEFDDDNNESAIGSSPKSYEEQKLPINYQTVQDSALSLVINGDSSLPARYKYIYSRKGHKQLVHMNYVYTKHSTSHGKTSWRCVQYFSLNRCPATVETIDSMLYAVNHQHNHEDCFEKLSKNSIYEMSLEDK